LFWNRVLDKQVLSLLLQYSEGQVSLSLF
jgi:hypothetical protein